MNIYAIFQAEFVLFLAYALIAFRLVQPLQIEPAKG